MRISINAKALGAFKKLGAAALITATMFFVACKQTSGGGGGGTTTPKHAVTFSVEGSNGTLKAKADGVPETSTSPINIEEGKTITFTATANDGYRVKGWTLDGKPITEAGTNTEYKLKVSKSATVKVSFEAIPKHAITFGVDSTTPNGMLKAKADGVDETSTSPINVEEGKAVIFTATADAGYRVKGWTLDGNAVNGTAETYTHTVTKTTTVSVSFEVASVEGGAVLILSPDKLTINVEAKTEDGSAITVEGCKETTLASGKKTILTATDTKVILKGNITELYCYTNKLTELNVQGLTALKWLNCRDNQLTALNVQGCTALQGLDCSQNQLTALNVQGLTTLQGLSCGDNKLTELNVQGCTALEDLRCHSNKLTELNVQGLTALQMLDCRDNKLTELNVQGCAALQKLGCYSNQLNAQAMTELLNALPAREAGDNAMAVLYTEETGVTEGNHKDYTQPAELKDAFDGAKKKNWKLQKMNANESLEDL